MKSEYYTVFDDEVGRLKFEFYRGRVFLHLKPFGSAIRVVRRLYSMRDEIAVMLRRIGFRKMYVFFRPSDTLERLCSRLGFRRIRADNAWIVMEADNA